MVAFGDGKKVPHERGTGLTFPEIVGQDELKRALLAVAANDGLDGLLVQGEKGTAKSTAVRALTDLLPRQTVIEGCPFGCPPGTPAEQCADCRERTDPATAERPVPLVTLPLGATRERVVGTLSVADALDGEHEFDPGLLARANRGILYVDEVNLLDDHLVDVLLDAAASGVNRVERDGVSVVHPTEFTLVGTMNPEEGDLRPQLRDRFALQATVTGCEDLERRVAIIDRAVDGGRDDRPDDPSRDRDRTRPGERQSVEALRERLLQARDRLATVDLPTEFKTRIAELCRDAGLDGHRGDIAMARGARTLAALDGRSKVIETDVRRAAELALPHRLRSQPFEDAPDPSEVIDDRFGDDEGESGEEETGREEQANGDDGSAEKGDETDAEEEGHPRDGDRRDGGGGPQDGPEQSDGTDTDRDATSTTGQSPHAGDQEHDTEGATASSPKGQGEPGPDSGHGRDDAGDGTNEAGDAGDGTNEEAEPGEESDATPIVPGQSSAEIGAGRGPDISAPDSVEDGDRMGRRTASRPTRAGNGARVRIRRGTAEGSIDAAASVRAAGVRGSTAVESRDLRHSVRQQDAGALVVFAVDASASMLPAMRTAKGTVLELLKDAYEHRDEVAVVAFAGEDAEVLLPPTSSVTLAARHLKELPTGDRTPLPAGLRTARDVLERADPAAGVVVLVTDGRANVADGSPVGATRAAAKAVAETGARVIVVDASDTDGNGRSDLVDTITEETRGRRIPLSALSPAEVDAAVGAASEQGDGKSGL